MLWTRFFWVFPLYLVDGAYDAYMNAVKSSMQHDELIIPFVFRPFCVLYIDASCPA